MLRSPKLGALALLLTAIGGGWYLREKGAADTPRVGDAAAAGTATNARRSVEDPAQAAFEAKAHGRALTVQGVVERLLTDDRDGSPHQRFIIRTPRGLSLLVAHNLDLAPRLEGLKSGDSLTVSGEYEWNEKGGVMHWTHHDPQGHHAPGYIEWRGRQYR